MPAHSAHIGRVGIQHRVLPRLDRNEGGLAGAGLQLGAGVQLAKDVFSDVRSNPTAIPPQETDAGTRLQKLKKLRADELISEEEYQQKKQEILSQL